MRPLPGTSAGDARGLRPRPSVATSKYMLLARALRVALSASLMFGTVAGCGRGGASSNDPPVPASHDPKGEDIVVGAVVAAEEKSGGVRLYLVKRVKYLPPPSTDALQMVAFKEKGNDFLHAAKLYRQRKLTVAIPTVDVERHNFVLRDYRVLAIEELGDEVPKLERDQALGPIKKLVKRPEEIAREYAPGS